MPSDLNLGCATASKILKKKVEKVGVKGASKDVKAMAVTEKVNDGKGRVWIGGQVFSCVLDTGATQTTVTKAVIQRLQNGTQSKNGDKSSGVSIERVRPYHVALADGTKLTVKLHAIVDLTLMTVAGKTRLRQVRAQVIPGKSEEVLVGQPELDKLGIVSPEEQLQAVQARVAEEAAALSDDEKEEVMVCRGGPTVSGEVVKDVAEMCRRTSDNGASSEFVEDVTQLVNDTSDLWRNELGKDPPAKVIPYSIKVTDDSMTNKPARVRRYSPEHIEAMKSQVNELIKAGVARKSSSPWASPVLLVKKKNGKWRMCIDLRRVNEVTETENWPLPRIDDLIKKCQGTKVYAKFDLTSGYWQFPVSEESIKYFAFSTPFGIFEMTRVPMGAKNSGAYFQKTMSEVLKPLENQGVMVYLDDVLVVADSDEQLLKRVKDFFNVLNKVGIKLHPKKAELYKKEVVWCGHKISADGITVDPEKVEALMAVPEPETAGQLMTFLCAANWLREKVPLLTKESEPLKKLLNSVMEGKRRTKRVAKGIKLKDKWDESHKQAFAAVKNALSNAVTLCHVDRNKEMCLFTDASEDHWGAILTQVPKEDLDKDFEEQRHEPLAFLSGSFRSAQHRWAIVDKEAFAIKISMEKLEYMLRIGKPFHIYTDHRNLKYIFGMKTKTGLMAKTTLGRLSRWALLIRSFDYQIEHISGEKNLWADLLSRWGCGIAKSNESAAKVVRYVKDERIVARLQQWFELPREREWPTKEEIRDTQQRVITEEDKDREGLVRDERNLWIQRDGDRERVWLPQDERTKDLRSRLAIVAHAACAGHRGKDVTVNAIKSWLVWPNMDGEIREFVENCLQCARCRSDALINRPWGEQVHASKPGEVLHMDFMQVCNRADSDLRYILVLKDDLSHLVELVPTARTDAESVIETCMKWFSRMGIPEVIVTDQGAHFRNVLVGDLEHHMGVRHHFTLPYCPWSNGTVERVNRDIKRLLQVLRSEFRVEEKDWDRLIPLIQYVLNTQKYRSLGNMAPMQVISTIEPRDPLTFVLRRRSRMEESLVDRVDVDEVREYFDSLQGALVGMHKRVKEIRLRRHLQNVRAQGDVQLPKLAIGDFVLVARSVKSRNPKLNVKWVGPYVVVDTESPYIMVVQKVGGTRETRKKVHVRRIKRYADRLLNVTEELVEQLHFDQEKFPVETFVDWRRDVNHELEVRVRWRGYDAGWDTWEPLVRMLEDVPSITRRYMHEHVEEDPMFRQLLVDGLSGEV